MSKSHKFLRINVQIYDKKVVFFLEQSCKFIGKNQNFTEKTCLFVRKKL